MKGQILIESIIALSISVVGLLGILALLSQSVSLNRVVSQQFIGNYLASEGVEIAKNLIDANIIQGRPWNEGFTTGSFEADYQSLSLGADQSRQLLFNSATGLYSYTSGSISPFRRTINIVIVGADEIKVNSVVRWTTRGGGSSEINLEDHFLNWRP